VFLHSGDSPPAYAADVAVGKAKAEEVCVDCHGDDATGDDESPDIVKLSAKEFVKAKRMSAPDVANLAAYYQALK